MKLLPSHPSSCERWGFSMMSRAQDERYLHYIISRYAAFRNIGWSMANEYGLLKHKTTDDWNFIGNYVMQEDPYGHFRSIHQCIVPFDHSAPWITHCSFQCTDAYVTTKKTDVWREQFGKPVIVDEFGYEGNMQHGWGNLTAEEMIRRFWEATIRGGYAGHSETIIPADPAHRLDEPFWWSHGGELRGKTAERIRFLRKVLKDVPDGSGLKKFVHDWDDLCAVPENEPANGLEICSYYLLYYSFQAPSFRQFHFDDTTEFRVEILDTWNMTVTDLGIMKGKFTVKLPGRPYMAVRIKAI